MPYSQGWQRTAKSMDPFWRTLGFYVWTCMLSVHHSRPKAGIYPFLQCWSTVGTLDYTCGDFLRRTISNKMLILRETILSRRTKSHPGRRATSEVAKAILPGLHTESGVPFSLWRQGKGLPTSGVHWRGIPSQQLE